MWNDLVVRHPQIFSENILIIMCDQGDECFMEHALVISRSRESSDDRSTAGRGTLESISSDSPYGDN